MSNNSGDQDDGAEITRKSSVAYAAGLSIFFSVAAFLGIGWAIDSWLGTSPWGIVGGILIGSTAGFIQFIRIMSRVK